MKSMKAYSNILKYRMNMALKRRVINNYPIIAYIEPAMICNLRCPACPTGLQMGLRSPEIIKSDLFKSVIDEIGDYVFELLMYNWGEPLLHKQTPELIQYAKKKNITIKLSTNLSINFSEDYIERLVKSGLDELIVSIDGASTETYQKYRRRGDFWLVRKNMLRIQQAKERLGLKTPKIIAQFLVFRHNEHEIEIAKAEYKSWGADTIKVAPAEMPFEPYNDGFEPSTITEYNLYNPEHPYQVRTKMFLENNRPCSWLYGTFVMSPNGKVSPCCATASEKDDFSEYSASGGFFNAWNSERFKLARELFKKPFKQEKITQKQLVNIAKRLDGMAAQVSDSLKSSHLICHKCPIIFLQDSVDILVFDIAENLLRRFIEEKDIKAFISLLLMGMPISQEMLDGVSHSHKKRPFAVAIVQLSIRASNYLRILYQGILKKLFQPA